MTRPWLDEIGITYAKNFDEVEGARAEFQRQRTAVLELLADVCAASLAERGYESERDKVIGGWATFWVRGAYAKVRKDAGRAGDRESAICFGLDHDASFRAHAGERFGFGVYLLFKMSPKRFNQLRAPLSIGGHPIDHYGEDAAAYVRTYWAVPGGNSFTLDAFERAVSDAAQTLHQVDSALAPAFRKAKFGGTAG